MVGNIHDGEIISVQELQTASSEPKVSQHNELAGRAPEQMVEWLPFKLLEQSRCLASIYLIEADTDVRRITMDDRKLGSYRLPSKSLNRLLDFN